MFGIGALLIAVGVVITIIIVTQYSEYWLALAMFVACTGLGTFLVIRDMNGEIKHVMVGEYITNNIPEYIQNPDGIVMDIYTGFSSSFDDDDGDQIDEILTKSMYRIQKWEKVNSRKYGSYGEGTYYVLVGKYDE